MSSLLPAAIHEVRFKVENSDTHSICLDRQGQLAPNHVVAPEIIDLSIMVELALVLYFLRKVLSIHKSVASSLRLPQPEVEARLRTELAIALFAQGILSFGKASELAGTSRYAFAGLIDQRKLPRHYTDEELTQDLEYAGGQ